MTSNFILSKLSLKGDYSRAHPFCFAKGGGGEGGGERWGGGEQGGGEGIITCSILVILAVKTTIWGLPDNVLHRAWNFCEHNKFIMYLFYCNFIEWVHAMLHSIGYNTRFIRFDTNLLQKMKNPKASIYCLVTLIAKKTYKSTYLDCVVDDTFAAN